MTETTETAAPFHPARRAYRFTVLFFVGFMIYGSYFAYDAPGAIVDSLMKALDVEQGEIGALYSFYSWGAILTLALTGLLVDLIGTRRASLLFSGTVTLGAVMVALAPSYGVMLAGRMVFGAGSEALIVTQSAILARWFKGKELALAFGVALTISRLGTMFTFNTEALIAERFGPQSALWVAAVLCGASLLANLVYVGMDRHAEPILGLEEEAAGDRIRLGDLRGLNPSFWFVTLLCLTFYSAIFPFTSLSTNFFHEKWGLPLTAGEGGGFFYQVFYNFIHMFDTAPGTTSIIIFASMICAPFAGFMVDRIGRRAVLMMLGSVLLVPSFLLMAFTALPPVIPMVVLGAAFVLVPAAMWPSVPLVVDKRIVGTAYGVMTLIQNLGLMAFPYLNGALRETTGAYSASMVMFASLGLVGLLFAVLLWRADRAAGHVLERPQARE